MSNREETIGRGGAVAALLGLVGLLSFAAAASAQAQAADIREEPAACKVPAQAEKLSFKQCRKTLTPDAVSVAYLKGKQPAAPDAIATLGPDLFGDKISLYNGSFHFEHTEFELPGNNALTVALVRHHPPGRRPLVRGAMADWDLNTPRVEGTFAESEGWIPEFGSVNNRCSAFNSPPGVTRGGFSAQDFMPWEYWQGTNLVIPGQGSQEILKRSPAYLRKPLDGASYPLVTSNNWQIDCLPSLQNNAGEGFFAVSPDGVRYRFDWMASRPQAFLKKGDAVLTRRDFFLMATLVTDRFGNWVSYSYDSANPMNLQRIQSSDGRAISLTYLNGRVSSANDGTRTWRYFYSAQGDLQTVLQPDNSSWQFDLRGLVAPELVPIPNEGIATCDSMPESPGGVFTGSITHPSGAKGTFASMFSPRGRTNVPRVCETLPGVFPYVEVNPTWPRSMANQGLISKRISGPGMEDMVWSYADYALPEGGWTTCTDCPDRKFVLVTEPSGATTRHTFGISFRVNEGQLLRTDEGWDVEGNSALRATNFGYRTANGQQFPDGFGDSVHLTNNYLNSRNRPQDQRVISQQGVPFTWQVDPNAAGFDEFARPIRVNSFSGLGHSRTYLTDHHDNFGVWVLGQTGRVTELTTGKVVEAQASTPPRP
jgi:hypothetical protein